ncbi:hypothetical protein H0H92_003058, partial [Tricholoma furcatifolium]
MTNDISPTDFGDHADLRSFRTLNNGLSTAKSNRVAQVVETAYRYERVPNLWRVEHFSEMKLRRLYAI